uniref:(northern house mosquito) hypothetical protein n=1 Tax=Culex pipiens TaxID=7175 RepID=A0A8D8FCB8_CULPI
MVRWRISAATRTNSSKWCSTSTPRKRASRPTPTMDGPSRGASSKASSARGTNPVAGTPARAIRAARCRSGTSRTAAGSTWRRLRRLASFAALQRPASTPGWGRTSAGSSRSCGGTAKVQFEEETMKKLGFFAGKPNIK